jgi:hypothetical protein
MEKRSVTPMFFYHQTMPRSPFLRYGGRPSRIQGVVDRGMDEKAQEWVAGVALLIAVVMILAGMAMIFSEDWITKIEGLIAAPALIGGGVAIIVALVGGKKK